jgi:hypothetical protein
VEQDQRRAQLKPVSLRSLGTVADFNGLLEGEDVNADLHNRAFGTLELVHTDHLANDLHAMVPSCPRMALLD